MGFLLWAGVGAVVGYLAAQRRGFSPATGVVAGLVLGPLAVLLFVVPLPGSTTVQQPQECPIAWAGLGLTRAFVTTAARFWRTDEGESPGRPLPESFGYLGSPDVAVSGATGMTRRASDPGVRGHWPAAAWKP